jgi:starch synthase
LQKLGVTTRIIIPRYRAIDLAKHGFTLFPLASEVAVPVGLDWVPYKVYRGVLPKTSVEVFLIGNDRFFDREGIYVDAETGKDYPDQADRWICFQRAALEFISVAFPDVDVLHCHDHQTGLIPAYLERFYRRDGRLTNTASVFTIHNLGYQGLFPREVMTRAGFDDNEFYPMSSFEFYGAMNFMKTGISYADLITTVSETYAREIQGSREFGYGLEGVLRDRSRDLIGILNGIDDELWNPATDTLIAARYSASDPSGKIENKRALLAKYGLSDQRIDRPVLAMISRIDVQKGFDLVLSVFDNLMSRDLYFLLLGAGHKETESYLKALAQRHKGKAGIRFAFDNGSAHLTEAGADIFLMPSKYEPCGLNQMYSLRYGTVPVVRATGGLADTIREFDPRSGQGNGFRFDDYDADQFQAAIGRALELWPNRDAWRRLVQNGMRQDFSWRESAKKYVDVYRAVASRRRRA